MDLVVTLFRPDQFHTRTYFTVTYVSASIANFSTAIEFGDTVLYDIYLLYIIGSMWDSESFWYFFLLHIYVGKQAHPELSVGLDVLIVDLKYYTSIFLDFVQNLPCLVFIPVTLILVTTTPTHAPPKHKSWIRPWLWQSNLNEIRIYNDSLYPGLPLSQMTILNRTSCVNLMNYRI
jgi:hypothetical protein